MGAVGAKLRVMLTTIVGLGAAGLLLMFLEMFLPGLIAGVVGGIMLIVAIVMSYDHYGAAGGNAALVIGLTLSGIMWWWWATHFQNTRFGKRMTLQTSVDGKTATQLLTEFVGQNGTAVTDLRPAGTVVIDGRRVDAISDGEFIENGQNVRVLRAQGICVVVRRSV